MLEFTYKDLIDVAIGSPESGHVNFYALHVLLSNFAQKLECLHDPVDQDDYLLANMRLQSSLIGKSSKYRLHAGADAEEPPTEAAPHEPEAAAAPAAEPAPAEAEPEAAPPAPSAAEATAADQPAEPEAAPAAAAAEPEVTPTAATPAAEEAATPAPEPSPEPEAQAGISPPNIPSRASSRTSKLDKTPSRAEGSMIGSLAKLERRISRVELQKEQKEMELQNYLSVVTGQLKLTMEQLNNVTHLVLDRKPDPDRMKLLRHIARQLRVLMRVADDEVSISWTSGEAVVEELEVVEEEEEEQSALAESSTPTEMAKPEEEMELDQHLCYSPERMLKELLELKSEFCGLTNKVNELSAELLKQDAKRLIEMMQEMQAAMREVKLGSAANNEANQGMFTKLNNAITQIASLKNSVAHLDELKIDKADVELLLAEKVDFPQLATKVSLEQLEEYKERLEKQFCEVRYIINVNEKNVLQIIDGLRMTLGIDSLELSLKDFRELIEKRVTLIAEALHKYMEMTNDDCAAAAGRVKVMQDLACISCDTPCVMRTMERSKLPVPASAKASTSLGPLITYELGQIRKSGIMGYYRKDEFPHSTNAWTQGMGTVPVSKCVPRHAGGLHTIHTAEEHMQKVVLSKKHAGWV
ncbi:nucleosome-remodeling factor subunit BPTF [Drosophila albomicans]|uniref:Nucleosome-remodeling factor subunit BPTF n=1 Tax=Drosophila albomicans TaxID=7291 RepID=A0A6P8Y1Q1_DROAB|nr:nucleosome-remodeling factor subunit BPTF [Drosophila albomicans]